MSDVPDLPASAPRAEEAPRAPAAQPSGAQAAAATTTAPSAGGTRSPAAAPRPRQRLVRRTLLVLGPLVVIVGAIYVYLTTGRFVSTESIASIRSRYRCLKWTGRSPA